MTTSPFPILQTTRLTLREVTPLDAPSLLTYLADERVVKPIGLAPFQTEADALDEINWYHAIRTEQTGLRWGITEHATPDIIGSCGFLNRSSRHQRAELGFELSPTHWGKGLAQEAVRAVLAHGFNEWNLNRIEALVLPDNTATQRLLERLGFKREGLLRQYEKTRGQFDDLYMYSLLKTEWQDGSIHNKNTSLY